MTENFHLDSSTYVLSSNDTNFNQCTIISVSLVLLVSALASGMRRGPHHPQGQSSKHNHYRPRGDRPLTGESQVLHDIK